jgi:hypothetical protein
MNAKRINITATRIALKSADCAKGSKRIMITIVAALSVIYAVKNVMRKGRQ